MKLMTEEIRAALPPLYSTEDVPLADKVVLAKFFNPCGAGTWLATEFDGEDLFFGWAEIAPGYGEWGYFSLSELSGVTLPFGLGIERDVYFGTRKFGETEYATR